MNTKQAFAQLRRSPGSSRGKPDFLRLAAQMARDLEAQKAIGARLKELRESRSPRIRQQAVANHCDVTLRAYQMWEAGDSGISEENYTQLAAFFDVSEAYLKYGDDPPLRLTGDLAGQVAQLTRRVDLLLDLLARREGFETPEQMLAALEQAPPPQVPDTP